MRACFAASWVCVVILSACGAHAQGVEGEKPVAVEQDQVEPQFKEFAQVAAAHPDAVWVMPGSWYGSFRLFVMETVPGMDPGRSLRGIVVFEDADATCAVTYKGGTPLTQLLRHPPMTFGQNDDTAAVQDRVNLAVQKQIDAMVPTKDLIFVRAGARHAEPLMAMLGQRVIAAGGRLHVVELPSMEDVQTRGAARRAVLEAGGTWQTLETPASDEPALQQLLARAHVVDEAQGIYQTTSLGSSGMFTRSLPFLMPKDNELVTKLATLAEVKSPDPVLRIEFDRQDDVRAAKLMNPPEELAKIPQAVQAALLNSVYTWQRVKNGPYVVTLTYLVSGGGSQ